MLTRCGRPDLRRAGAGDHDDLHAVHRRLQPRRGHVPPDRHGCLHVRRGDLRRGRAGARRPRRRRFRAGTELRRAAGDVAADVVLPAAVRDHSRTTAACFAAESPRRLPAGTMNLFARTLRVPMDLEQARGIAAGPAVDIVTAHGRPFVHQYSVGCCAARAHPRGARLPQPLAEDAGEREGGVGHARQAAAVQGRYRGPARHRAPRLRYRRPTMLPKYIPYATISTAGAQCLSRQAHVALGPLKLIRVPGTEHHRVSKRP